MIVIKRPTGFKLLLKAANAAAYPAETSDPLNVDLYWAYADEPQNRRYAGTYPPNSTVKIPLATDQDRDVVVTTMARSSVGVQQRNDPADAPSTVLQSEREQRKPVIGIIRDATNTRLDIGVSFYPRHMRARRIIVASDAGFTSIVATYYEDVDKASAETPRLPEVFRLIRAVPGTGTATYYVKVAHSSFSTALRTEATQQLKLEALRWGPDSDPLTVTFADSNGAGGSTGTFNPFIATIDGYGGAPSTFLLTIPLAGEVNGVTGSSGGFADRLAIWTAGDTLNYSIPILADRQRGYVKASGFSGTVGAINVKTDYLASGSAYETTGTINSGQNTLVVPSSSHDFRVGEGIAVTGAGTAGAILYTSVQSISSDGLTITLNNNASTSVVAALVRHDDQVAINNALTDGLTSHRTVHLPSGTYWTRGLTLTGEVNFQGENKKTTFIRSVTNAPILTTAKDPSTFQGPKIEKLTILGDVAAGSAQIGLVCDDVEVIFNMHVHDIRIEDCGGYGLHVLKCFASTFEDIYISNCEGYPLVYDAQNMPANHFRRVDAGLLRAAAPVSYRIKAGIFVMQSGNTIYNVVDDSIVAVVGRKSGVDGDVTNGRAFATWIDCNFESYTLGAVHHYYSSRSAFRGSCTFAAQAAIILDAAGISSGATTITVNSTSGFPAAGKGQMEHETFSYTSKDPTQFFGVTRGIDGTTAAAHSQYTIVSNKQVIPLKYEMDTIGSYPALEARCPIEDTCNFNDGPEWKYKDNAAIHSNAIPPLMTMGRGPGASSEQPPIGTYLNTTSSTVEALQRADGMLKRITVNGTRVIADQGVRWIEVDNTSGAGMDLTLPPPNLIKTQELMIVKDVAGNAATHAINIYGGGGASMDGGGGAYTLSEDFQAAIFISNEETSPNGSWRLIATHPAPGVLNTTGGGVAGYLPIYTDNRTVTGGPLYELAPGGPLVCKDAVVAETDDINDLGGDGFNRFRDIFASRKMKAPEFRTPGGNGLFGGTADPEGSQVAEIGSIYLRTNGQWYRKATGSSNTGWVPQGGSVTASGSGLADFAAFFSSDTNINAGPMYRSGTTTVFQGAQVPDTHDSYDNGSASLKWRSGYFGTKLQTVTYEFTNGLKITSGTGSPEGVVTANLGSLWLDDSSGQLYRKASGFGNTGWVLQSTTDANLALSNLASVAINQSLTPNADNTLDLGSSANSWRDLWADRDLMVGRRIVATGSAPSTSTGTGAGTSPSLTVDGNEICGAILLTTGTSPATNSKILDMTVTAYTNYPVVMIFPGNAAAATAIAEGRLFVDDASMLTTKWTLKSGATALSASTDYVFYYQIKGF